MEDKLTITITRDIINIHFIGQIKRGDFVTCGDEGFEYINLKDENIPRIIGRAITDSDDEGSAMMVIL